jgi:hypothetical protein
MIGRRSAGDRHGIELLVTLRLLDLGIEVRLLLEWPNCVARMNAFAFFLLYPMIHLQERQSAGRIGVFINDFRRLVSRSCEGERQTFNFHTVEIRFNGRQSRPSD